MLRNRNIKLSKWMRSFVFFHYWINSALCFGVEGGSEAGCVGVRCVCVCVGGLRAYVIDVIRRRERLGLRNVFGLIMQT